MFATRQLPRLSLTLRVRSRCMGYGSHRDLFRGGGCSAVFMQRACVTNHTGGFGGTAHGDVGTAKTTGLAEGSELVKDLQLELKNLNKQLDQANEIIRHLVKLVDSGRFAAEMALCEKHMEGGGGLFVTKTSTELEKALRTPGARIILMENYHYVLGTLGAVNITNTNVTIIGNNATIEGYLRISREASLEASNVTFLSPGRDSGEGKEVHRDWRCTTILPCIEATQNSHVHLRNCKLLSGRDGLYLGIESRASLENVLVADCARGLYEGVRCRVSLLGCRFEGNYFHIVLLGHDSGERAKQLVEPCSVPSTPSSTPECPVSFVDTSEYGKKHTRADIVLDHDPILDVYAECIHKGKRITLPAHLATCDLSDPVY